MNSSTLAVAVRVDLCRAQPAFQIIKRWRLGSVQVTGLADLLKPKALGPRATAPRPCMRAEAGSARCQEGGRWWPLRRDEEAVKAFQAKVAEHIHA